MFINQSFLTNLLSNEKCKNSNVNIKKYTIPFPFKTTVTHVLCMLCGGAGCLMPPLVAPSNTTCTVRRGATECRVTCPQGTVSPSDYARCERYQEAAENLTENSLIHFNYPFYKKWRQFCLSEP
jgi:hypothetical protein